MPPFSRFTIAMTTSTSYDFTNKEQHIILQDFDINTVFSCLILSITLFSVSISIYYFAGIKFQEEHVLK